MGVAQVWLVEFDCVLKVGVVEQLSDMGDVSSAESTVEVDIASLVSDDVSVVSTASVVTREESQEPLDTN